MYDPLNSPLPMGIDTNEPVKGKSSPHIQELFGTLWLICSVAGGVYVLLQQPDIQPYVGGIIIAQGYIVYLALCLCCNKTRSYLTHIKSAQEYESIYYSMTNARAYFEFHAQCYHTEIHHHRNSDGSTRTEHRKVVTHTATERLDPPLCNDVSGHIETIYEDKSMVFFHYIPRFNFNSPQSQRMFENYYNMFKSRNALDTHQVYTYKYVIPGFQERISFYTKKKASSAGFFICGLLGLAYPYAVLVERAIARYTINIVKVLGF